MLFFAMITISGKVLYHIIYVVQTAKENSIHTGTDTDHVKVVIS